MGNIFKNMDFMHGAGVREFKIYALQNIAMLFNELDNVSGMNDQLKITILTIATVIGVKGKEIINEKEKNFIGDIFNIVCNMDKDTAVAQVDRELNEDSYRVAKDLAEMSPQIFAYFSNIVLCFAYIDGIFEEEPAQHMSDIAASSMNIFMGSPEDYLNSIPDDENENFEDDEYWDENEDYEESVKKHFEWKAAYAEAEKKREEWKEKMISQKREELEKELNQKRDSEVSNAKKRIESYEKQKKTLQNELEHLGFFAFGEKNEKKNEIKSLENSIIEENKKLTDAEEKFKASKKMIPARVGKYANSINLDESGIPLEEGPKESRRLSFGVREEVYYLLYQKKGIAMTQNEIAKELRIPNDSFLYECLLWLCKTKKIQSNQKGMVCRYMIGK